MRRVLPVAMLSVLLAAAPAAVAQHGGSGGHAGGGFHGGFSGGHASFGGFHSGFAGYSGFRGGFSTAQSYGRFSGGVARFYGGAGQYRAGYGGAGVYRPEYQPGREIRGRRGHYHVRNSGYYGYGGYPAYVNSWELLPWDLGYPDDTDDDTSAAQPAAEPGPEYGPEPEGGYEPGPDSGYREDYAPAAYEAAPQAPITPEPQLTLIYKDGHTQQVRNYALTQDALLDLDEADSGRVTHIPLASLNLAATEKAAQQAGLEFAPPAS